MAKAETESAKITNVDSLTVSAAVLGDIFGVSDRRIRQMAEEESSSAWRKAGTTSRNPLRIISYL